MRNVYDILTERGFLEQCTDDEGLKKLFETPQTVYCGFDPTASSLHLGNLIPIMALMHLQRAGHRVLALVGGATGMIGDPSGKSAERSFLDEETLRGNVAAVQRQLGQFIKFEAGEIENPAVLVNNYDWMKNITIIDWLRTVGKQVTVNYMVAKESVRRRFEDRDQGISYTEFSYMLMQAFDFAHLNSTFDCRVQVGGGDQWGNITTGIDLIRRRGGEQAYGFTFPLLMTASGAKFGKSEAGAVYLNNDSNQGKQFTTVWDFYQYLVRADDRDVIKLMKFYTFLDMKEIAEYEQKVVEEPEKREAQKRLAYELTTLVHGEKQAKKMVQAAEALYAKELEKLELDLIFQIFKDGARGEIAGADLEAGVPVVDVVADLGLCKSKGEARRMAKQGALYVNDQRAAGEQKLTLSDRLESGAIILRKGKKDYGIITIK